MVRSPELREAALTGTLNRPTCPGCNRRFDAAEPLVYADAERGHWIAVAPPGDLSRWSAVEASTLEAFRTTLRTAAAETFRQTAVRIVFDLDELRERLAIWDAGLDDGIVECAKLQCLGETPTIRGSGERIRVHVITSATVQMRTASHEWSVERGGVENLANDPQWRERFPALFADGFVSIDRYLR